MQENKAIFIVKYHYLITCSQVVYVYNNLFLQL